MKSPSNIIVLAFLAVILFFSCERKPEIPTSLPLSGEWASMSAEMESSEYVSFKDGMLSSFISDNRYQVYANQLWHADRNQFKRAGSCKYSVLGNVLETENSRYQGEVSITDDTLSIAGCRYLRLESFNPSYYSRIEMAEEDRKVKCGFEESHHAVSYQLENALPWKVVEASSFSDWISEIQVLDDRITFTVLPSTKNRKGNVMVTYPHAESVRIQVEQSARRSIIVETEQTYDYHTGSYSIPYEIDNPISGSVLTAECDSEWLKVASVTSKNIEVSVEENNSGSDRTADLKLTYPEAKPVMVKVVQDWNNPVKTFSVKGVDFKMMKVEGSTFWMGAQANDPNGHNYDSGAGNYESPVHQVTLSDYFIGEFEVTQELWQAIMGSNPSRFSDNLSRPVEKVGWNDIVNDFLPKLNELLKDYVNGHKFVLPTEAQWEYAARGGNKSKGYKFSGSDDIDDVAWVGSDPSMGTHPVGQKLPNELGLYDMSGNVFEWCSDFMGDYIDGPQKDPQGPVSGSYRILRGGCWYGDVWYCRVSDRSGTHPDDRDDLYGFRLALVPDSH